ncbi:MAG: hypothetical protein OXC18_07745 [Desulfurellaceae bacterium]|nr:hypothetical protein [Desulfurellaceae bacterium]
MTVDPFMVGVAVFSALITFLALWFRIDSRVEQRVDRKIEQRYSAMEQRMNNMDQKFESTNQAIRELTGDVGFLKGQAQK